MNTEKRVRQAANVFATYGEEIHAMIALQAKDESVADDIFRDLFLSIVSKPVPADIQRVEAYLYRVITNDVIDAARRTKIYRDHIRGYGERIDRRKTQDRSEKAAIQLEETKRLLQSIKRQLPTREAEAVADTCVRDYDAGNGAREMNVDRRTFSRYLCTGLKRIRQFIGEDQRITFFNEDFSDVIAHVESLENSADDQAQVLYHIMELETALGKLEEKARATNRKYEARLAASLRDICRVHEPGNISEKQVKHFAASASALVKGWGVLTREKVAYIRSRLLEVGLTWLPVTDKATSDIAKAETVTE